MAKELIHNVMSDIQGFFRPGERERIYDMAKNPRDKLLIRLLWKTGRRISEILQLKIEHIDFENRNIMWNIAKKGREYRRWKPVDSTTLEMLKEYVTGKDVNRYVFESYGKNGHLTRFRVFQIIRELSEKAGVYYVGTKKPHPHHFRHSFATDIAKKLESPADMIKLKNIMEHSTVGMTEQYLQFADKDTRKLIEGLDD